MAAMQLYDINDLHFITEQNENYGHVQLAEMALRAGVRVIQYRRKQGGKRLMLAEAMQIKQLCQQHQALLIINDHLDLALAVGAKGVHLGQDDMPLDVARKLMGPAAIIGASVHSLEQARVAGQQGANYLGYGPVFATVSKDDAGAEKGVEALAGFCQQVANRAGLPVVALGGVNAANIQRVRRAGAQGVAIISAISHALDPAQAAFALLQQWQQRCALHHIGLRT